MSTACDLDLPRVEAISWRAICQHQLSEREMVIAATIIRRSFVAGRPFVRLGAQAELATLTGITRGNVHGTIERLVRGRALEVSQDGRVYTFLPPSRMWPWLYAPRIKTKLQQAAADALERAIDAANGLQQPELFRFASETDREWAEAITVEKIRGALLEHHRAATRPNTGDFPVSDREPKPADPAMGADGEPTRPPGTDLEPGTGYRSDISTAEAVPVASYYYHPPGTADPPGAETVPESGTCSQIGNNPLMHLSASVYPKDTQTLKTLSALSVPFPNREHASHWWPSDPLDPAATENEVVDYLRAVMGRKAMDEWGGFWRNSIRDCRRAVLEALGQLRLRIETRGEPESRGRWLRDQYYRFRRAFRGSDALRAAHLSRESAQTQNEEATNQ